MDDDLHPISADDIPSPTTMAAQLMAAEVMELIDAITARQRRRFVFCGRRE